METTISNNGLKLAAVPNPDHRRDQAYQPNPYMIAQPDKAYTWSQISLKLDTDMPSLAFASVIFYSKLAATYHRSNRAPNIIHHSAVVSDYLNQYHTATLEDRLKLSNNFSRYLVLSCWRKLRRRMCHWAMISLVHSLFYLDEPTTQAISSTKVESPQLSASSADFRLAKLLSNLSPNSLNPVMETVRDNPSLRKSIPNLLSKYKNTADKLYDHTTAIEFHSLFMAVLVTYARTLSLLQSASQSQASQSQASQSQASQIQIERIIKSLVGCVRLLSRIISSDAFSTYLETLGRHNLLSIPDERRREAATLFGKQNKIEVIHGWGYKPNTEANLTEMDKELDKELSEEDELYQITRQEISKRQLVWDVSRTWIKSLIDHFTAARILQHYRSSLPVDPDYDMKIKIVIIQGPDSNLRMTWDNLASTIKDLVDKPYILPACSKSYRETFDPEHIITMLQEHVVNACDSPQLVDSDRIPNAIKLFHSLVMNPSRQRPFGGTVHCEAALAAVLKYMMDKGPDDVVGDGATLQTLLGVSIAAYPVYNLG